MKTKMRTLQWFLTFAITVLLCTHVISAKATDTQAVLSTDRSTGICSFLVNELDAAVNTNLSLVVTNSDTNEVAYEENIAITEDILVNGTYTGSFSLEDVKYIFANYTVTITSGDRIFLSDICDFTIHQNKIDVSVFGNTGDTERTIKLNSTEASDDVLVPGTDNVAAVYVWKESDNESTAIQVDVPKPIVRSSLDWTIEPAAIKQAYGNWNAKIVLKNPNLSSDITLISTSYKVAPTASSFESKKNAALEKKASFQINLKELKNPYGAKSVAFQIYNSSGKKVTTVNATKNASTYSATVSLKKLNYKLNVYTIKAVITDTAGQKYTYDKTATVDETVSVEKLTITRKTNVTTVFKITKPYIPGNIKKMECVVYSVKDGTKKKIATYAAKKKDKNYTATAKNPAVGEYAVSVYGYTNWNQKVLLIQDNYKLLKKHMGKQGWYYEKYAGKTYKFYYEDNKKVTDLTDILKIHSGSNLYIEINRAACVVTIYLYNEETKKYDIPVKTCTVSVGRDVSTNAGANALNIKSSFTPIGSYSVCSNGQAVKYSLKPMHEPDGSVVYARYTTHIVGNVYFHAIAVYSQSHYALSPTTYNRLGTPASAGCIRMTVADAKWIYDNCITGTQIKIVTGSSAKPGPLGKNKTIRSNVNYDPTDPAVPDKLKKKDYKAGKISGYMTKSGKKVGY